MQIDLWQGDCLELMKNIPDGSVDLVLCDPPYQISNSSGGLLDKRKFIKQIDAMGMAKSGFDCYGFCKNLLPLFKSKEHFNAVIFCSRLQLKNYIQFAENNGFMYGLTVWHKSNPAPLCNNKYLNDLEFCFYIKGKKSHIYGDYYSKSLVYKSSVNQKDKKKYKHPTIKPIPLLEKYIINHSLEDQTILDPFMGSGSTGVAAKNLNRNFIGIELDENYFEIAKKRINDK